MLVRVRELDMASVGAVSMGDGCLREKVSNTSILISCIVSMAMAVAMTFLCCFEIVVGMCMAMVVALMVVTLSAMRMSMSAQYEETCQIRC